MKLIVGPILLSLREIGLSDGQCKGIFENPIDVHFATTFISKHFSLFMNNKNEFQPVNSYNETSAITIPTINQRRKQPCHLLVTESENMKEKPKTQKQITVAFPTTAEGLPHLETFANLSVPSKARKNAKPQKGCGFCGGKGKGEQATN